MVKTKGTKKLKVPRRPYDRERLIEEMKLIGEFGLRNKKELWKIQNMCDNMKRRARDLLISNDEKEFIVCGRALLNNLLKLGIFADIDLKSKSDISKNLEQALDLTAKDFLKRRLQHCVYAQGIASSVHQARSMIYHRHIAVKGAIVDCPGFLVNRDSEAYIELAPFSALKKRNARQEVPVEEGKE
ncbi:40S ribosomal protein S9 [Dictyocoela roeselum]|nr:40S ribosomal protein S9 [Dictyocoela roeselum]